MVYNYELNNDIHLQMLECEDDKQLKVQVLCLKTSHT